MINKSRVVIGIDPGTAITGYGLIREQENGELEWIAHGVVTTSSDWDEPRRLLKLYQNLGEIISTYKPNCCAVEKLFFQKNVKTAINVGSEYALRPASNVARPGYRNYCRQQNLKT